MAAGEGIHLLIQYCNDRRPDRAAEYDECVRRNLANPHVRRVHNLVEPQTVVPAEFRNHPRYTEVPLGRWLRYSDALDYANRTLPGETVCLANLDTFLDPDSNWPEAAEFLRAAPVVLCQSRIDLLADGTTAKDPELDRLLYATSQDAWVFAAPLHAPDCDFEIGTIGCDNGFAQRVRMAGRVPVNRPDRYKVFHIDRCRGKTFANYEEVHAAEAAHRPRSRFTGREGLYVVPDYDRAKSVDALLHTLNVPELHRYVVYCDTLNRLMKVRNP